MEAPCSLRPTTDTRKRNSSQRLLLTSLCVCDASITHQIYLPRILRLSCSDGELKAVLER